MDNTTIIKLIAKHVRSAAREEFKETEVSYSYKSLNDYLLSGKVSDEFKESVVQHAGLKLYWERGNLGGMSNGDDNKFADMVVSSVDTAKLFDSVVKPKAKKEPTQQDVDKKTATKKAASERRKLAYKLPTELFKVYNLNKNSSKDDVNKAAEEFLKNNTEYSVLSPQVIDTILYNIRRNINAARKGGSYQMGNPPYMKYLKEQTTMKNDNLKKLISECISEVIQEADGQSNLFQDPLLDDLVKLPDGEYEGKFGSPVVFLRKQGQKVIFIHHGHDMDRAIREFDSKFEGTNINFENLYDLQKTIQGGGFTNTMFDVKDLTHTNGFEMKIRKRARLPAKPKPTDANGDPLPSNKEAKLHAKRVESIGKQTIKFINDLARDKRFVVKKGEGSNIIIRDPKTGAEHSFDPSNVELPTMNESNQLNEDLVSTIGWALLGGSAGLGLGKVLTQAAIDKLDNRMNSGEFNGKTRGQVKLATQAIKRLSNDPEFVKAAQAAGAIDGRPSTKANMEIRNNLRTMIANSVGAEELRGLEKVLFTLAKRIK